MESLTDRQVVGAVRSVMSVVQTEKLRFVRFNHSFTKTTPTYTSHARRRRENVCVLGPVVPATGEAWTLSPSDPGPGVSPDAWLLPAQLC